MDFKDQLDVLARLSENHGIKELVRKAKLVKVEREEFCVRVWTVDDRTWEVRRTPSGDIYCNCPAYRFNKDTPRTCKHLTAIAAMFTTEEIPLYIHKKNRKKQGIIL